MSKENERHFREANKCQICNKLSSEKDIRVKAHEIMHEIGKFNQKINVIPNGLEKYMAFILGQKLIFTGNTQFMSSSSEKLVKNLPKEKFKHLFQEFCRRQ